MQTSKKVLNAITAIVLIFLSGCGNYVETSSQETVSQEIISSEIIASELKCTPMSRQKIKNYNDQG